MKQNTSKFKAYTVGYFHKHLKKFIFFSGAQSWATDAQGANHYTLDEARKMKHEIVLREKNTVKLKIYSVQIEEKE